MTDLAARALRTRGPALSDAMRKLHPHAHHVLDLVSPTPGRVLFGPAITMLFAPVRADVSKEDQDFARHLTRAVGDAAPGGVLVAAAPGVEHAAVAGGIRLTTMVSLGLAGLVTTARMRDFDEARGLPLACWCRGETPMAGSAQAMPVATNVPIALDGATILPGDLLHVSDAGAVVIPAKDLARALDLAEEIERADAERAKKGAR